MTPLSTNCTYCFRPAIVTGIADAYAALSSPGTADFQITAPDFLLRATMVALGPPGVTTSMSPSISGDSAYAQVPETPPNSCTTFFCQTIFPVAASMHARSPFELKTYNWLPSIVGVDLAIGYGGC